MSRKSRKQKPFSFRGKPKMTVGYIRLSVSDTEKENSIENQKHIIELWCVEHEMTIDKFYIDNGYSGRRFDRPAFTEMLNDIAEDKIACVIVKDLRNLDVEMNSSISYYERLVSGEISENEFAELMSVGRMLTLERDKLLEAEKEYDEKYKASQKLFKASRKEIPISEIMYYIQTITVHQGKEIVINWSEIF